jgi:hypothetical protein
MKIAILSRNAKLYSTRRLVEAAQARGHEVRVHRRAALLHEHHLAPPEHPLQGRGADRLRRRDSRASAPR